MYTAGLMYPTRNESRDAPVPTQQQSEEIAKVVHKQTNNDAEDVMVLQRWNGKLIAEQFELPEMEVEIERAVEQVETAIKGKEELIEEKIELEQATVRSDPEAKESPSKKPVENKIEQADKAIHEKAEDVAKK